jgi:hypothetical protein
LARQPVGHVSLAAHRGDRDWLCQHAVGVDQVLAKTPFERFKVSSWFAKDLKSVLQSLVTRLAWFTALMVVLGGCAAVVCGSLAGGSGVEAVGWAFGLCVVPGWAVLALEPWVRSPTQAVKFVLIGTAIRVAVVAAGAMALLAWRPDLPREMFLFALLVLYLASLAWETKTLTRAMAMHSGTTVGSAS